MSARSESISCLSSMCNGLYFNPAQPQTHSPRFPTVQCRYFNTKYGCRRGNNCFYAHGSDSSNPQYPKTPSTTKLLETMLNNQNILLKQNKSLTNELYLLKIKLKKIEENQQIFNNKQKANDENVNHDYSGMTQINEASKNCISGRDTADVSRQINISSIQNRDESKHNLILNDDANKLCNNITDSYIAGSVPATISTTKAGIPPAQKTEILSYKNKDINFEKINDILYPLNDTKSELIHKKYFKKSKNKQAYFIYLNHMSNHNDITLDEYNYLLDDYQEKLKQKRTTKNIENQINKNRNNNNNKSNKNKTKFNNKRNKKNRK